eukprot:scaffold281065_cov17-Prasinocladus_malaysianus.AAC.1
MKVPSLDRHGLALVIRQRTQQTKCCSMFRHQGIFQAAETQRYSAVSLCGGVDSPVCLWRRRRSTCGRCQTSAGQNRTGEIDHPRPSQASV